MCGGVGSSAKGWSTCTRTRRNASWWCTRRTGPGTARASIFAALGYCKWILGSELLRGVRSPSVTSHVSLLYVGRPLAGLCSSLLGAKGHVQCEGRKTKQSCNKRGCHPGIFQSQFLHAPLCVGIGGHSGTISSVHPEPVYQLRTQPRNFCVVSVEQCLLGIRVACPMAKNFIICDHFPIVSQLPPVFIKRSCQPAKKRSAVIPWVLPGAKM